MDFFVVPTVTFRLVYGWFVIGHGCRRILHFDVTANPSAAWVIQQLREAFPFGTGPRHLIFDRDSIFSAQVRAKIKSFGIEPARTSWQSPWQNGVAERWIGSVRRELLDHVVVLDERHLRRLLAEYIAYYHDDRLSLAIDCRSPRPRSHPVAPRKSSAATTRHRPSATARLDVLRISHLPRGACARSTRARKIGVAARRRSSSRPKGETGAPG